MANIDLAKLAEQMAGKRKLNMDGSPADPELDNTDPSMDPALLREPDMAAAGGPGAGQMAPEEVTPAAGRDWRAKMGDALQAAGASIQANVGPTYPGQALKTGIMRGIVGLGTLDAAKARMAAGTAAKQAEIQNQLMMLGAKHSYDETPVEAAAKAGAVSDREQGNKLALIAAQGAQGTARAQALKDAQMSTIKDDKTRAAYETAWKEIIDTENLKREAAKSSGDEYIAPSDTELTTRAYNRAQANLNPQPFKFAK
jgi:hypothetical protein